MRAFLICPAERSEVSGLSESEPLVNLCILGKPFIHYWMEHLSSRGAKEIQILSVDRPEQVRALVGDGSRWGLSVEITPQAEEPTCLEVSEKISSSEEATEIVLIDHFPNLPEAKLFTSHAAFYAAVQLWFSRNGGQTQVGMKEITPGIWVGLRSHISPRAKLHAPCWIGENVIVRADSEVGPLAILENGVAVEIGAAVQQCWIGRHTFVGSLTQIKESFALGNTLVDFRTDSIVKVPDPFLLCALRDRDLSFRSGNLLGRAAAFIVLLCTLPFVLVTFCRGKWQGHRILRPRRAMAPQIYGETSSTIVYYEFANASGGWKRWPQLWNVARGDFTWIGNRPLTSIEAGKLVNEFEQLWLAAPIGLISQGDSEGCTTIYSDEARAHASFYAVRANWRLDALIFFRAVKRLLSGKFVVQTPEEEALKEPRLPLATRFR